jgi:uncharacterized protein (DUF302 family)
MRERRVTARRLLVAIAVLGRAVVILAFGFLADSTALWAALLLRALLVWKVTPKLCKTEVRMNTLLRFAIVLLLSLSSVALGADGLIAIKSSLSVAETMNRFEQNAKQRGLNIFARIDHAGAAAKIGKTLRPTEVLIFGNPQGGTPFIECAQSVGIDLPLKVLVWQDAQGQVWLGYNDPAYLAQRHGVSQCAAVGPLSKALSSLAEAATTR